MADIKRTNGKMANCYGQLRRVHVYLLLKMAEEESGYMKDYDFVRVIED